jgi:hypothetical protein
VMMNCEVMAFFLIEYIIKSTASVVICQSSWLQIRRYWFDTRRYQIFLEVVGLERGPLSLVSTIEELLGRNSSGFCLENREYGRRDPPR